MQEPRTASSHPLTRECVFGGRIVNDLRCLIARFARASWFPLILPLIAFLPEVRVDIPQSGGTRKGMDEPMGEFSASAKDAPSQLNKAPELERPTMLVGFARYCRVADHATPRSVVPLILSAFTVPVKLSCRRGSFTLTDT